MNPGFKSCLPDTRKPCRSAQYWAPAHATARAAETLTIRRNVLAATAPSVPDDDVLLKREGFDQASLARRRHQVTSAR
jgi:hypothetical protein